MDKYKEFQERNAKHIHIVKWGYLVIMPYYIAALVIGALNFDNCPVEPMIPIVVTVNGAVSIVYCLAMYFQSVNPHNSCLNCTSSLLNLFKFIWLIVICVYFFQIFQPNFAHEHAPNYCNIVVFAFAGVSAFSIFVIPFLCIGLCICMCCWGCVAGCLACCCPCCFTTTTTRESGAGGPTGFSMVSTQEV